MNIGAIIHGQWRHMEGVQKYSCTEVQLYRCTDVQANVAIERMVAVGLTKRDPETCTIESSVKNRWADARGGNGEERKPKTPAVKRLKSKGWLQQEGILTFWGYAQFFRGSLCSYYGMLICIV